MRPDRLGDLGAASYPADDPRGAVPVQPLPIGAVEDAETVLAVLRERGRKGLPCNELYRQMFNRELYLMAYGRIYANQGAMTPGASGDTADGMSEAKIDEITEAMRHERYKFAPVRRV